MKDHEIAALVNDLRDIAKDYGQTQQLRDRISRRVLDAFATPTAIAWAALGLIVALLIV